MYIDNLSILLLVLLLGLLFVIWFMIFKEDSDSLILSVILITLVVFMGCALELAKTFDKNMKIESMEETSNVKELIQMNNKLFEKVYIKDSEGNDTYILMPVEE